MGKIDKVDIDIMVDGRFVCTISAPESAISRGDDYDGRLIEQYVESVRPSLKNKKYSIEM